MSHPATIPARPIRRLGSALCLSLALAAPWTNSLAQSAADLARGSADPSSVLVQGMGYDAKRFTPLAKINKRNVSHLVPVWTTSLANSLGQEAMPLVYDGVMYVTTHTSTFAINTQTGKVIWKSDLDFAPDVPKEACCGLVNRGAAIFEGKLYRTTLDAFVIAMDAKTGKQLWKSQVADYKHGYSMTGAPLIANGVLITGISGGEYGIRGFLDGWDPETGKQLWHRFTTAAPDEKDGDTWPGDTAQHGGAPTWVTGSFDPDLDLVYWGTGNGGPWNAELRKGDNLYICSVLAIRPKTGEIVWHYQFSPNDPYDYDGVNELVQAEIKVDGKPRKVIMQANRNGYLYVLDRTDGKLLAANPFVKVTWADGIDMTTGRPIESAITKKMRATGEKVEIWPSALGGKNWMPASYNPGTGLFYANTLNFGMPYKPTKAEYKAGEWYWGFEFSGWVWPDGPRGYLKALDPMTGKSKWEMPYDVPSFSGTLSTGGGLVFTGSETGEFMAIDATTGKKLWQFQTGSGIISQPISWEQNGKQYVTVLSGIGGVYPLFSGDERLANIPAGSSVTTFALTE